VIDSVSALEPAEVLTRSGSSSGTNVLESTTQDDKGIFTSLEEPKNEGSPRRLMRKGFRTLQWKATDPDGDALVYDLSFRPVGGAKWMLLRSDVREASYSFDSTSLPDGEYVFRVTASDVEANPGEGKTSTRDSSPVRVDNTPPVVRETSRGAGFVEIEAADSPRRSSRPTTALTRGSGSGSSRRTACRIPLARRTASPCRRRRRARTCSSGSWTRRGTSRRCR
jgi:hypothetical protein